MSSDNTLINKEMTEVRATGKGAHYLIKAQLYINKKWITPLRIDMYSVERDYELSFADVRVLSFTMLMGAYTYDLLPYRNDIQVDVTYVPVGEVGASQLSDLRAFTRRYRGFVMDLDNAALTTNVSNQGNRTALDNHPPKNVEMQLVEEYIYDLQMRTIGRKFRDQTPHTALLEILTGTLYYGEGKDEKRILGVNSVGTPNKETRSLISIPHGTPIGKVPNILQNKEGGIFPTGLGCYLQDQQWYVYPLYDTTHASKQTKLTSIYCVPTDRYEGSEKTYRVTDNRLIILAGGEVASLNVNENNQFQAGNGIRFLDARKLLNGFAVSKENRMLVDKASNLFEVASKQITEGINNIQWSATPISANPFAQYSAMARMDGRIVTVQWRHGDCDLLDPGQLIEFYAISEGKIAKFKGVLLGVHELRIASEAGMAITRHAGQVMLKLFIENQPAVTTGV